MLSIRVGGRAQRHALLHRPPYMRLLESTDTLGSVTLLALMEHLLFRFL